MWAQCNFKKKDSDKTTQGWIPVKHAKVGKFMQLLDLGMAYPNYELLRDVGGSIPQDCLILAGNA